MSDPAVTHCDAVLPHAATLEAQLALLQSDDLRTARPACRAFCAAADEYLQLPTLLDPLLPSLLPPLFTLLSARLTSLPAAPAAPTARELLLARLPADALYTLSKVRRLKPFSRHFPHRVSHLHALSRHVARAAAAFPPDHYWTVHYVLLAWAAVAIQLPFPLRTILQPAALAGLLDPARDALHRSGPVAAVAAAFLARLAARRDAAAERADLLASAVRTALEPADSPAMRIPALTLLAAIFKFAHRDDLRLHVAPVRDALAPLLRPHKTNTTEAHLFTKLGGRLALAVLPPRLAPWRYDRGRRVVFEKRDGVPRRAGEGVVAGHVGVVEDGEAEEDDEMEEEAAETLETVVEILLSGLAHPDTVVRWSAAKGVGRVTSRLPLVYAQDVVNSVLDLYSHVGEARADASWHGGCLALAELARRGLLLPREPQFAQTFDVIGKAAAFDMRRGANSTGAHVRDAACYGVWAMARAYSREDLAPYAKQITNCMLPLALLDREVNCRRAAAAALQECVGRLSERLFEDGISLITLADYFSLGDRVAAYLRIAPQVASLAGGEHFDCILYHLTHKKLVHWDPAVRALASQGLAALLAVDNGNVIVKRVVPELLQMAKERGDMVIRHGAVLGLAEVVRVVGAENLDQAGAEVRNVLHMLEGTKAFNGRTGDRMRLACCHLIECLARGAGDLYAHSQAGRKDAEHALGFLERIYGSGKENMYRKATSAYEAICNDVIANDSDWHIKITRRILHGLSKDKSPIQKRGFALAAGVCGESEVTNEVVNVLCHEVSANTDVETRRNLALSLSKIPGRIVRARFVEVLDALTNGMRDFTRDERGDIGSLVREAAMRSASYITNSFLGEMATFSDFQAQREIDEALTRSFRGIMEQCCCRIDRTREVAGSCLKEYCTALYRHKGATKTASICEEVIDCFGTFLIEDDADAVGRVIVFGDAESVFSAVRYALNISAVSDVLILGLVSSGGGTGSQAKAAVNALVRYFEDESDLERKRDQFRMILQIIESGDERLIMPAFSVLSVLFAKQVLSDINASEFIRLAQATRASWRKKLGMIKRTVAAVQLLSEMAGTSLIGDCFDFRELSVGRVCLEALMVVLGGSIPRLRRITADCIYVTLIQYAVDDIGELDEAEKSYVQTECPSVLQALDVLVGTEWVYLSTVDARKRRNLLCKLLKISPPTLVKSATPAADQKVLVAVQ